MSNFSKELVALKNLSLSNKDFATLSECKIEALVNVLIKNDETLYDEYQLNLYNLISKRLPELKDRIR